tara:strand:+ start:229 stop:420 length:192 start_codon:yes stop_codon:yes gene_type:complete
MEINKEGIVYYFKKDKNENNDLFYERCRFAANTKPTNEIDLNKSIQLSKIKINEKYLGCKYEE